MCVCVSLVCSESEESCAVIAGLGMKSKLKLCITFSLPLGNISMNQSDINLYLEVYAFIYLYMYNIPSVSQTFAIFFCANIDILTDNRKPKE